MSNHLAMHLAGFQLHTGHYLLTEEVLARGGEGTSQCVQVIPVLSEVPIGLGSFPELAIWKRFIQKHSAYAHFGYPEHSNVYPNNRN